MNSGYLKEAPISNALFKVDIGGKYFCHNCGEDLSLLKHSEANKHIDDESIKEKHLNIPVFTFSNEEGEFQVITKDSLKFGVMKTEKKRITRFFQRKDGKEAKKFKLESKKYKKLPRSFIKAKNSQIVLLQYNIDFFLDFSQISSDKKFTFTKTNLKI